MTTNETKLGPGSEMARDVFGMLLDLGASPEQARRATLRAFARLALTLRPQVISPAVEERALSIASGMEF